MFVSPKEEEERKDDMVFQGKLAGKTLTVTTTGPDGTSWQRTRDRAPSLKRKSRPKWRKPTQLFNGKDLSGWKMSDPSATPTWKVENGTLVSPGRGAELITDAKFQDFKLHIEFNCAHGSNSAVYLRGRYELEIDDDSEPEGPTGGALDSHEALPGPIYLQGSEAGHVAFRNITITPAR
jgi:hypothetical protein